MAYKVIGFLNTMLNEKNQTNPPIYHFKYLASSMVRIFEIHPAKSIEIYNTKILAICAASLKKKENPWSGHN